MKHVVSSFIMPLSACFTVRPGQDFELFAKQLMEDLAAYPEPVLSEAVVSLRRTHRSASWPTIAECLEAVQESAHRQYRPPEKAEPARRTVQPPRLRLDPGGGMLSMEEMRSCPVGTQFWAADATIRYPNGAVETWGEMRRRRHEQRQDREPELIPG